jgi:DNA-binding NarL/FixJ family response regulator
MSLPSQVSPAFADARLDTPIEDPIRVVLADDHALMRRALRLLLSADAGVEVVAESDELSTIARCVIDNRPDVLVIDLSMSNGTSLEVIRRLRDEVPGTQIVVLTMEESNVFARQAHDAGAIGFVIKQSADGELLESVRTAARGEAYVSPRVAALSRDTQTPDLAEDETYGNGR